MGKASRGKKERSRERDEQWTAIVDRLTFGGNIIETGSESYRLAQTKARAGQAHTG